VALACSTFLVVLVVAGTLAVRWNGADPQPRPSLDDYADLPVMPNSVRKSLQAEVIAASGSA
jgi:hypothetical protein